MATAVQDPAAVSVWKDGRSDADPLAWRWHGPALGIALAMALATAIVSMSDGLEVRDTDKMLSGRIVLLLGTLAFFIVIDLIPRAIKRGGPFHTTLLAVARERWNRRRVGAVCLGLVSFYVTYLSYRNLKGFLPFLTDQDFDPKLLSLDRSIFLGHDPGPLLHNLLGTGIAAHLLSSVYLFFLAFVPISLGAALIASSNPIPGLWYVTALGLNWTLGVVSYLVLPALGPVFVEPGFYANLPETGTAALQQALIYERHEALAGQAAQSIAAFASLHVSVVFTAALIAQLLHLNRYLRIALWTFLGLTFVATLYFGWHYLVDDIAGFGIGVIAVVLAGVATGHLRLQVPVRWRPAHPQRAHARADRDRPRGRAAAARQQRRVDDRRGAVRDRLAHRPLRRPPRPPLARAERVRHARRPVRRQAARARIAGRARRRRPHPGLGRRDHRRARDLGHGAALVREAPGRRDRAPGRSARRRWSARSSRCSR